MKKLSLLLLLFNSTLMLFAQNNNDSLYNAILSGDTTIMVSLIKNGANVNFVKQEGWVRVSLLITPPCGASTLRTT
jgi:hypothetical protein